MVQEIDQESFETIQKAIELGVTFFDTAEVYGPFINEELLGRAIKGKRDQLIIATKFGFNIVNGKIAGVNNRPENIKEAVEGSLKRLGTDHIDLLYQHRVDPNVPIEEVIGAMSELVWQGKVRFLGLSEAGVKTIRRAHKTHPISALQSEYSLWERNLEPEIIPLLRELNIGLVPFSPLGRGFLTGSAKPAEFYGENDFRRQDPRFQKKNFDANMRILKLVEHIAKKNKATPAQIAIAWLLSKGEDIAPIPGTKKRAYLEENVGAAHINLSKEDKEELSQTLPVAGARYGEQHQSYIDR